MPSAFREAATVSGEAFPEIADARPSRASMLNSSWIMSRRGPRHSEKLSVSSITPNVLCWSAAAGSKCRIMGLYGYSQIPSSASGLAKNRRSAFA